MEDKEIKTIADKLKGMFSEEDLKIMEEAYNQLVVKHKMEELLSGSNETK